ncbi:MAG: bifunctional heptose 7-phosphate kinase/heptose 1-phosphate adenyltransferase, partial [Syntrophothermus sp.]
MVRRNTDLLNTIEAFSDRKILVLGEAMLDSYLQGTSERLCQEAPVPVVDIHHTVHVPGGAANTAVNLRGLGAQVLFLSAVGEDETSSKLEKDLEEKEVSAAHLLHVSGRDTLAKQRILSGSQIIVRFDQGTPAPLDRESETKL